MILIIWFIWVSCSSRRWWLFVNRNKL